MKHFVHFEAADQMLRLYKLFIDVDSTQVEVNPFGETDTNKGKLTSLNKK